MTPEHHRELIHAQIDAERAHQDEKWGANRIMPDEVWLSILVEEVGETAKEILERGSRSKVELTLELIQVAAVAVAWIEAIDKTNT